MFLVQATGPLFFLAKQTGVARQTLACEDRGSIFVFSFWLKKLATTCWCKICSCRFSIPQCIDWCPLWTNGLVFWFLRSCCSWKVTLLKIKYNELLPSYVPASHTGAWFESFLRDRTRFVSTDGASSQGSVLGPLLLLIHIYIHFAFGWYHPQTRPLLPFICWRYIGLFNIRLCWRPRTCWDQFKNGLRIAS